MLHGDVEAPRRRAYDQNPRARRGRLRRQGITRPGRDNLQASNQEL